jgi:hypothetical protein
MRSIRPLALVLGDSKLQAGSNIERTCFLCSKECSMAALLMEDGIEGNPQYLPDRLNSEVASVNL